MRKCDTCAETKTETKIDANGKVMCKDCFMDCDDFYFLGSLWDTDDKEVD